MSRTASKQSRKPTRRASASIPSFLLKLYEMLENPCESISWDSEGNSFIVRNINEFSETVLPKFFKHNNFASFVRQLNMYDFHKIRHENQEHEFQHRLFRRNAKHLLPQIKRKITEMQDDESTYSQPVTSCSHTSEVVKLKRELTSNQKELITLNNRLSDVEKLSEHLLKQNTNLISDTKSLVQDIMQNGDQKEKNMQKMILALFSMVNNGSIFFSNRKNFPSVSMGHPQTFEQLSLQNGPQYQTNYTGMPAYPQSNYSSVSLHENNHQNDGKMSCGLEDLSKQISSSLFGSNLNEKNGYLNKHLDQLNAREQENQMLASKFFNKKQEKTEPVSELAGNLPSEKKRITRAASQKNAPQIIPKEKEEIPSFPQGRKKRKVAEQPINALNSTATAQAQQNPPQNLFRDNYIHHMNPIHSHQEPHIPTAWNNYPRDRNVHFKMDDYERQQQFYSFAPEDIFLACEKPRYQDMQQGFDDYIGTGTGGSADSESVSPPRIEGYF